MMVRIVKCSRCGGEDIKSKAMQNDRDGFPLGEWPLYYVGSPVEPHIAEHYFCDAYCSNAWYKEKRDAEEGTDE